MDNSRYIAYLSPVGKNGTYTTCNVEVISGKDRGKVFYQDFSPAYFEKYFHGTVTAFFKTTDHGIVMIEGTKNIIENFDVQFCYVVGYNEMNNSIIASNGQVYDIINNFFCNHNPKTAQNILWDLKDSKCFYMQLIIEITTGKVLDITFVKNPAKNAPFYKHCVSRGFVPVDNGILRGFAISNKTITKVKSSDEKLSQTDIDKLLEDILSR